MISIKRFEAPRLNKPTFHCDCALADKLNNYEITRLMNKHNFTLFLGRGGSGKSTLLISFLKSKPLFKKVFHTIILFCPPNSRASINGDFWAKNLDDDDIYDELSLSNLEEAYIKAEANAAEGLKTLIILDDVQAALKGENEKILLHMINNKRHAGMSIWMACQNYISIPKQVRMNLTDLFIFKASKPELENLMKEQIEMPAETFQKVLPYIFTDSHDFLYINPLSRRFFANWNEIIIEKDQLV